MRKNRRTYYRNNGITDWINGRFGSEYWGLKPSCSKITFDFCSEVVMAGYLAMVDSNWCFNC